RDPRSWGPRSGHNPLLRPCKRDEKRGVPPIVTKGSPSYGNSLSNAAVLSPVKNVAAPDREERSSVRTQEKDD
ncbi:hypothetical protein R1flu_017137, partial [Riccia fluitans]